MKLSISLSDADVATLDAYLRESGLQSRSAAVQRAIRLLARERLEDDYAQAWQEWDGSPDRAGWESTAADGLE